MSAATGWKTRFPHKDAHWVVLASHAALCGAESTNWQDITEDTPHCVPCSHHLIDWVILAESVQKVTVPRGPR